MSTGLTREKLIAAFKIMESDPPGYHTPEGLCQRIIFCPGDTLAVVNYMGYLYCVDELFLKQYRSCKTHSDYVDEQLKEQLNG